MGRQPEGKRRMQEDTQQLQCSVRMQRSEGSGRLGVHRPSITCQFHL